MKLTHKNKFQYILTFYENSGEIVSVRREISVEM
jgi:hypothetical protein